jgi:hypothetical protein
MAQEFGKRRFHSAVEADRPARAPINSRHESKDTHLAVVTSSPIAPMDAQQGAGFVAVGFVLGGLLYGSVFARAPEYYQVVVEPARLYDELPDGTTREIIYTPKERPQS